MLLSQLQLLHVRPSATCKRQLHGRKLAESAMFDARTMFEATQGCAARLNVLEQPSSQQQLFAGAFR